MLIGQSRASRTFAEYCEYPCVYNSASMSQSRTSNLYRRQGPGCIYADTVPATYTRVARSLAWVRSVARGTTDSLCNTAD